MTLRERIGWVPDDYVDIVRILANYKRLYEQDLKPRYNASHNDGKHAHTTESYTWRLFDDPDIDLYWSFCPKCMQVRHKYIIGFDNKEGIAIIRDFIKDGRKVQED